MMDFQFLKGTLCDARKLALADNLSAGNTNRWAQYDCAVTSDRYFAERYKDCKC